jgi:tRNA (mo5U34)-methyltransferase
MSVAAEVAKARWYHTIELPGGIVTPGDYDLPDVSRRIPFPPSLRGRRCLDVGTRDGFWAFEMERRGATEVLAIDLANPDELDFPEPRPVLSAAAKASLDRRSSAFTIAHRALESRVEWRNLSVYDLSPAEVGQFDFAFIGTLLLHLRNPVDALAAIRRVLRPGGQLMSNDVISLPLTLSRPRQPTAEVWMTAPRPYWQLPNVAAHRRFVRAAGFDITSSGARTSCATAPAGSRCVPLGGSTGSCAAGARHTPGSSPNRCPPTSAPASDPSASGSFWAEPAARLNRPGFLGALDLGNEDGVADGLGVQADDRLEALPAVPACRLGTHSGVLNVGHLVAALGRRGSCPNPRTRIAVLNGASSSAGGEVAA